jgi:hypothetical protein
MKYIYAILLFLFCSFHSFGQSISLVSESEYESYKNKFSHQPIKIKDLSPNSTLMETYYFSSSSTPKKEIGDTIWIKLPALSDTTLQYHFGKRGITELEMKLYCEKDTLLATNYLNNKFYDGIVYQPHTQENSICAISSTYYLMITTHNKIANISNPYFRILIYYSEKKK